MSIILSVAIIAPAILKLVCSFSFQSRYINLHITSHSKSSARSVSIDTNCHHNEIDGDWDNDLRHEAAVALLPVFFPEHTDGTPIKPVPAEVALKRLLRKKYSQRQQHHQSNNNATTTDGNKSSMDKSRGRLAELILGTSVMRLRHFVVTAATAAQDNATFPLPYPLNYTEISPHFNENLIISEYTSCSTEQKMHMCKLMVREHAKYIASKDSTQQLQAIQSTLMSRSSDSTLLLAIEYSIPLFLASSLLSQYGFDTAKQICSLMNEPGPITIRKNAIQFQGSDEELCKLIWENDGVEALPMKNILKLQNIDIYDLDKVKQYKGNGRVMGQLLSPPAGCICINPITDGSGRKKLPKSIWSMSSYQKGLFEVQDAGSQCIVQALDLASPSMRGSMDVLDYCAGNGGKTFAIASAAFDRKIESENDECKGKIAVVNVVSHDVVDERLRQIKGSLSRVGFILDEATGIAECERDELKCTLQTMSPTNLKELSANDKMFDVVLVDAPCSSSGVLRRRPSQRWLMSKEDTLGYLPDLQLDIIQKAASFVKNNGILVYATCSLLKEENEQVIRHFEKSDVFVNGGFVPWPFPVEDHDFSRHHEVTLLPSEWNDGFFFARYRKESFI